MLPVLIIIGIGIILVGGLFAAVYNNVVRLRNRYREAFSQIDVQLKRRHDLISNLVETAKGYMKHERATLEAVAIARSGAMSAIRGAEAQPGDSEPMRQLSTAESALTGALGQFLVRWEAYPELKANQTMLNLMEELTTTENRIALARQAYNDAAMFYNTAVQTFPVRLLAGPLQFEQAEFFVLEDIAEKEVPRASFN